MFFFTILVFTILIVVNVFVVTQIAMEWKVWVNLPTSKRIKLSTERQSSFPRKAQRKILFVAPPWRYINWIDKSTQIQHTIFIYRHVVICYVINNWIRLVPPRRSRLTPTSWTLSFSRIFLSRLPLRKFRKLSTTLRWTVHHFKSSLILVVLLAYNLYRGLAHGC